MLTDTLVGLYLSFVPGDIDRIYVFEVDTGQNGVAPEIIFTENETNYEKFTCAGKKNEPEYVKDSFHDYVINGKAFSYDIIESLK